MTQGRLPRTWNAHAPVSHAPYQIQCSFVSACLRPVYSGETRAFSRALHGPLTFEQCCLGRATPAVSSGVRSSLPPECYPNNALASSRAYSLVTQFRFDSAAAYSRRPKARYHVLY